MDLKREEDFMQKEDAFASTDIELIRNLNDTGKITAQYANLLRSFQSSTLGPAEASLRKVQAVIALKDTLKDRTISQRHTAYIGSRFDWHFPVALGARDIAMIDLIYQNPGPRQELLRSLIHYGAEIKTVGIDNSVITFVLDLGIARESVTLRLDTDVFTYKPQQPLGFVLQFYGPWEKTSKVPVRENVARGMTNDAIVLNSDYSHSRYAPGMGMEIIERGDFYLYQVKDIDKMIASSIAEVSADEPPEAYSKISRAIRDSRQKKS